MASKKRSAKGRFVATRATRVKNPPRKRRRRNPDTGTALVASSAPVGNPPLFRDLAEFVLPGFGGYAATKFLARVVNTQLSKKFPKAGKHLAAGSTVGAFLAAWFLAHKIKRLEKYHTPIVVGSAIASLQTLVRLYLPKYGWMVADFEAAPAKQLGPTVGGRALVQDIAPETLFPGGPEVIDFPTDDGSVEAAADLDLGMDLGSLGSGEDPGDDYMDALN